MGCQTCLDLPSCSQPLPHSWSKWQKSAYNWIQKFVKLTDKTYACNSLTNFEYYVPSMTGNGNYMNLLELPWKNL
jgi:hypothetical protein